MSAVVAVCEKCGHRTVHEDSERLPNVCAQEDCGCTLFVFKRIFLRPYSLTKDDVSFLKAIRILPA